MERNGDIHFHVPLLYGITSITISICKEISKLKYPREVKNCLPNNLAALKSLELAELNLHKKIPNFCIIV